MKEKKIERNIRLKVEKSEFPDEEGTHLLVQHTKTAHGWGYRRLFKGTYKECIEMKKKMEEEHESKNENTRVPRKK